MSGGRSYGEVRSYTGMTEPPEAESMGADATQAMVHVEQLCACGDRFAGQPGDGPAARYVEDCLRSYGLEIERTPCELVSFRERSCRVELADGTKLDALSAYYSVSTPGPLEAPVV